MDTSKVMPTSYPHHEGGGNALVDKGQYPTSKVISSSIGSSNGSTEITKLFYNKYRSLYSSVPTDDNELCEIHDVINSRLSTSTHITVTPDIIKQCIHKLKPGKDDGDLGFKSDHIINGSHRLHVLLSL